MPVFLLLQVSEAQKERKEREERYTVRKFCWVTECCGDIVEPWKVRASAGAMRWALNIKEAPLFPFSFNPTGPAIGIHKP